MIDKLKGIEPLEQNNKTQRVRQPEKVKQSDSISISPESQRMAEAYLAKRIAMDAPDVREDKIAEMKLKFQDPTYMDRALDDLAGKLLNILG